MRRATLLLFVLTLLATSRSVQAQTSPYAQYEELLKSGRWEEAVEVADRIDKLYPDDFQRLQKAARARKDMATLLHFQAREEIYFNSENAEYSRERYDEILTRYARATLSGGFTPRDGYIAATIKLLAGDTTGYIIGLLSAQKVRLANVNGFAQDQLKQLYFPRLRRAVAERDTATAAQLIRITPVWMGELHDDRALRDAFVLAGDFERAARMVADSVFVELVPFHRETQHGNPDAALQVAELHAPAGLRLGKVWFDPLLQFFGGDQKGGLARMEALADSAWPMTWDRQLNDTLQFCMVMAGDLARRAGQPARAMGWYHRATWLEYNHFLKIFMTETEGANHPISRTSYYRTLGVIRQADLLLRRGRPSLALDELFALATLDTEVRSTVNRFPVLTRNWKAISDSLQAWNTQLLMGRGGTPGIPRSETPDSLGYFANDWLVRPDGTARARRPTRVVLDMDLAQIAARSDYLDEARKSADAEATKRRFEAYQEKVRQAAEELEAAVPTPATGRTQAFQFRSSARNDVCFRCKGRGFQYVAPDVKQSWTYDKLNETTRDTKIYTSGHLETCSWCKGTGKR